MSAVSAILCGGVIDKIDSTNDHGLNNIDFLAVFTLLIGTIQTLVGFFRFGLFSMIFSDNFLVAFNMGCSVVIFSTQLPTALGIEMDKQLLKEYSKYPSTLKVRDQYNSILFNNLFDQTKTPIVFAIFLRQIRYDG